MRTYLDHLPGSKQRELEHVVQVLFEEFREAQENAAGRRKRGRIVKIILYGSHAPGAAGSMSRIPPRAMCRTSTC